MLRKTVKIYRANSKKKGILIIFQELLSLVPVSILILATMMILEVFARKAYTYFPCTFNSLKHTPLEAVQRVLDVLLGPTVSTKNGFFPQ